MQCFLKMKHWRATPIKFGLTPLIYKFDIWGSVGFTCVLKDIIAKTKNDYQRHLVVMFSDPSRQSIWKGGKPVIYRYTPTTLLCFLDLYIYTNEYQNVKQFSKAIYQEHPHWTALHPHRSCFVFKIKYWRLWWNTTLLQLMVAGYTQLYSILTLQKDFFLQ